MAALDEILTRQAGVEDQRLRQAAHAADWTTTFSGAQSTEALRAQRNVTDMVSQALDRKAQLLAQTDDKAARAYATNVKTQEFIEQAPLRDELLRRRIDATGAATRFQQIKETRVNQAASRFYQGVLDAPPPGTPERTAYMTKLARDNVEFMTTAAGRDAFTAIAEEDEVATKLETMVAPPGTKLGSVTFGRRGVQQATFRDAEDEPKQRPLPAAALTKVAELNAAKAGKEQWLAKETYAPNKEKLQTEIADIDAQLQAWRDTVNPPAARETGGGPTAPKVDKRSLAEQALNDPEATEEDKARARKILGQ